ncbi:MAG: hypothetical protein MN733_43185, partial [Nitrososphaera sp.]|nr:hypothetical protein [Nitrososphaera sp.]
MSVMLAQQYLSEEAQTLRQQYQIDAGTTFELRLELETPLMISAFKSDVPVPGLPNLDGILQFAAFYWCVRNATAKYPKLATDFLWQVNDAIRGSGWIDFPVPLSQIPIRQSGKGRSNYLYDCSVGLPVDGTSHSVFYPVGSEFLNERGEQLLQVIDNVPLRRRLAEPTRMHKAVQLGKKLDTSRGAYKALDNRMYNSVITEYWFAFRGDASWVKRLLEAMRSDEIGIGKKSSLGYGQIRQIAVSKGAGAMVTLSHRLSVTQAQSLDIDPATPVIALLKNIPTDELYRWGAEPTATNKELLSIENVRILSIIPQLAGYVPP